MRLLIFHIIVNSDSFQRQGMRIPLLNFTYTWQQLLKTSTGDKQHKAAKALSLSLFYEGKLSFVNGERRLSAEALRLEKWRQRLCSRVLYQLLPALL